MKVSFFFDSILMLLTYERSPLLTRTCLSIQLTRAQNRFETFLSTFEHCLHLAMPTMGTCSRTLHNGNGVALYALY